MDTLCVVSFAVSFAVILVAVFLYVQTWRLRRDTQSHLNVAQKIYASTQEGLDEAGRVNESTAEILAKIESTRGAIT